MKISKNIRLIVNESYKWRNRDLLQKKGDKLTPKLNFIKLLSSNFLLLIIGILQAVFFGGILSEKFASHVMTSLSIFTGLFLTVLILVFDKYLSNSFHSSSIEKNKKSSHKANFIRTKNFTRRFVYISLEGLLISTVLILIFSIALFLDDISQKYLFDYEFSRSINLFTLKTFIINFLIFILRTITFILLFKFIMFLMYIITALSAYIKGVFDNNVKL